MAQRSGSRPEDNLPEVVPQLDPVLPEVVPDTSPQAVPYDEAQQRHLQEPHKYPASYDNAPKYVHEPPVMEYDPERQAYYNHETQAWMPANSPLTNMTVSPATPSVPWVVPAGESVDGSTGAPQASNERRIWGVKRRTLFIVLAVVIIVVAAAIGGGVGGAMAAKSSDESSEVTSHSVPPVATGHSSTSSSSSTSSGSWMTSTTSSSTIQSSTATQTSSSGPSPTYIPPDITINNETFPGPWAFQPFSDEKYGDKALEPITAAGYYDFDWAAKSYVIYQEKYNKYHGLCVTFCDSADSTGDGWWCDDREQPLASKPFRRVHIWALGETGSREQPDRRCSDDQALYTDGVKPSNAQFTIPTSLPHAPQETGMSGALIGVR